MDSFQTVNFICLITNLQLNKGFNKWILVDTQTATFEISSPSN